MIFNVNSINIKKMKLLKCVFSIIEKNIGSFLIATAIIIAAIIYAYFNPYQSCKRDLADNYYPSVVAHICSGSG